MASGLFVNAAYIITALLVLKLRAACLSHHPRFPCRWVFCFALPTFSFDLPQIMDLELSRDESILTVTAGKEIHFLDAASMDSLKVHKMERIAEGASLHPDNKTFLAGGTDLWVRVFDFETGAELECHKGHHGPVHCLRYSPKGKSYASGADDATIRIWRRQGDYESKA